MIHKWLNLNSYILGISKWSFKVKRFRLDLRLILQISKNKSFRIRKDPLKISYPEAHTKLWPKFLDWFFFIFYPGSLNDSSVVSHRKWPLKKAEIDSKGGYKINYQPSPFAGISDEGLPCLNTLEQIFVGILVATLVLAVTAVFLLWDTIYGVYQSVTNLMEKDSDQRKDLKKLEKESYQLLCMTWVNDDDYFIRSVNNYLDQLRLGPWK